MRLWVVCGDTGIVYRAVLVEAALTVDVLCPRGPTQTHEHRVLRVPTCTDCCAILTASAQRQFSRMTSVDIYPVAQPNAVQRLGGGKRPIGAAVPGIDDSATLANTSLW
jgi:hypothetical protein